jgi:hypothetical protein
MSNDPAHTRRATQQIMSQLAAIAAAWLAMTGISTAQQVEWKQTINLPKGLNLPAGVKANILGIELGDGYAEAKAKLQKLLAESPPPPKAKQTNDLVLQMELDTAAQISGADRSPPFQEIKRITFFTPPGGGPRIEISYPGQFRLKRELPGKGARKIEDNLIVLLSAPSSGNQVLAIQRNVHFFEQNDQPRISEIVANLKQKFGASPFVFKGNGGDSYIYQFDNGAQFKATDLISCGPGIGVNTDDTNERKLKDMNGRGNCDVLLSVSINHGISPDHASSMSFLLADNERAKQNLTADYAFFRAYMKSLQDKVRGAAPKL